MTDKKKIRAEIERLLNAEWKWRRSIEGKYRCETYRELLQFIDSLPEEPVSKGLEEEINGYIDPLTPAEIQENPFTSIEKCARYFANWQKEQMMKEVAEGTYDCDDTESWISFNGWIESTSKVGDKVKIIVIKEDEK